MRSGLSTKHERLLRSFFLWAAVPWSLSSNLFCRPMKGCSRPKRPGGVPRRRFPTASRRPPVRYRDASLPLAWLPGAWIGDGKISQGQIGEFLRQTLARLCLDWLQCRRRLQLGRRQGAHQFLDVLKLAGVCVVAFRGIAWLSMPSSRAVQFRKSCRSGGRTCLFQEKTEDDGDGYAIEQRLEASLVMLQRHL